MSSRIAFLATEAATARAAAPALAAGVADATLLAPYKKPADSAAFDAYYSVHHAPLAKTLPIPNSYPSRKVRPSSRVSKASLKRASTI